MVPALLVVALVVLVLAGITAPYETLGWWAGWFGDTPGTDEPPEAGERDGPSDDPPADHYVIYLSGIAAISPDAFSPLEQRFLASLSEELPDTELVDDVFPYSTRNRALTGQRVFAWLWRALAGLKGRGRLGVISFLINIRNLWQVLVSSDLRFGPLYNYASAELLYGTLLAHGYRPKSGVPVTILGYSGGGQIAVGAGPLLKRAVGAPVHVVSLGGVMSSNEGVLELDSITHLYGSKDGTQRLGAIIFPERWPVMAHSPWNRARRAGIIRNVAMGPTRHTGRGGYLDPDATYEDGQPHLDRTVATVADLVRAQRPG